MKLEVKIFPRAKKERILRTDDALKVYTTEPAIQGRANKRLIGLLAEYFHTKKYNITIIKGEKQRDKIVEIK